MKKDIRIINHLINSSKRIYACALVVVAMVIGGIMVYSMAYSSEMKGGMGMHDDEADFLDSLPQTMDLLEALELKRQAFPQYYENDPNYVAPTPETYGSRAGNVSPTTKSQTNSVATSVPAEEATTVETKTDQVVDKTIHDFDSITNEAKSAFVSFTSDGKPESCYLNINANSESNIISGKELNYTRTGKEDGTISFVKEGKIVSKWLFSNWESEDDFQIDLTSKFEKMEGSEYPETWELKFADGDTAENDVTYFINTSNPDTEWHIYSKDSNEYNEIYVGTSDHEGMLELHPTKLGTYIVSKTDILSFDQENASQKKTEDETSDTESIRDGSETIEITEVNKQEAESVTEQPEESVFDEISETKENKNSAVTTILIIVLALAALTCTAFAVLKMKNAKNQ